MSERESRDDAGARDAGRALAPLAELARRKLPPEGEAQAERQRQGFERLSAALRARPAHAAHRARRPLGVALALAGTAIFVGAALGTIVGRGILRAPEAISYTVAGAGSGEAGYVRAAETAEAQIRFSDGTAVDLGATARGRVAWTSARGGRVVLESGHARVHVVHRDRAEWFFDAGPFVIQVTGTSFEMRWSAPEQVLEVVMRAGAVTVRGPASPDGVKLREGQRLTIGARDGVVHVEPIGEPGVPAPTPSLAPSAPPPEEPAAEPPPALSTAAAPASPTTSRRPSPEPGRAPSWSRRVAARDFDGVLADARRRGFDAALRTAPADDVMALADAARYTSHADLARRALLAERARFPASELAQRAAFLLGRMAEDVDANPARAIAWYDRYLRESPGGAYRSEALGRKMTATLRTRGPDEARPMAEEVLRQAPAGPYAAAAHKILGH